MNPLFRRVAIVNRGEPAMRFIHAAREFNLEHGAGLLTIALFTEPDRNSMFVREADEAFCLGPARVLDHETGQLKSSYVDYGILKRALIESRSEAVWVGWGFVAEHADFADLCRDMEITFIGPDGDAMRRVGDKIASKLLAERLEIPVAPWSGGPVRTIEEALKHAGTLGYPVLFKASAGGGGSGIRCVESLDQLETAFISAQSQAFKAFGDGTVFLEKRTKDVRHVEVQVIADHFGTTWSVGVRDCTIQRRHQKILEEAPSPALSADEDRMIRDYAVRLCQAAGYRNAGTMEFLYEPQARRFSFMEMNTRLQVEHPVTECTTGLDLVKLQIHLAQGGRLEGEPPRTYGHAIEVRLNAEDPENNFTPAPGGIERFRTPAGPGVRIDTGVAEGDIIPGDFDSMIAKIVAYGQTRSEALARLQRALRASVVVIKGGTTNKSFLLQLLEREEVKKSQLHNGWLDQLAAEGKHISRSYADVALLQAAIDACEAQLVVEQGQFYAWAGRGRPDVRSEIGRTVQLRHCGQSYSAKVFFLGGQRYRILVDGVLIEAEVTPLTGFEHWLTVSNRRFHVVSIANGVSFRIEVDGVEHHVDRDDGGIVHAPAPAVVVSIAVRPGDVVAVGDRLAVLEAMKMEMPLLAPFAGKVRQIMAIPNVQVGAGAPLLQIDPGLAEKCDSDLGRVQFCNANAQIKATTTSFAESLQEFRQLMLGFDIEPKETQRRLAELRAIPPQSDQDIWNTENAILSIFADTCSLFQREPDVNHRANAEEPSAEAQLFTYLRRLDAENEALSATFLATLKRALEHYGVLSLDPSPRLAQSLMCIYRSHQRIEQQVPVIVHILQQRLRQVELLSPQAEQSLRTLLDRLVSLAHAVPAAIIDLAREVRHRYCDQPFLERARKQVYEEVEEQLSAIASNPEAPGRKEKVRALVECPQPLVGLLSGRFATATVAMRKLMLEAIVWRYYRIRQLEDFRSFETESRCYATAEYDFEGKRIHVIATHTEYEHLAEAIQAVKPLIARAPANHDVMVDFYTWKAGELGSADSAEKEIRSVLDHAEFPRPLRRAVIEIAGPEYVQGAGGMQHFTYRPTEHGYQEETLYRGIHPMMGKRLRLWRLANFNVERLPSVEDVYLLRAVARENPKDERLFACAEVRDVTPVRDEAGRVVQLPHLERMLTEALAAIRVEQSRRAPHQRLCWNRVFLHVWQPLYLEREEFRNLVHRLTPMTEGLGLEQVVMRVRIPNPRTNELRAMVLRISSPAGRGMFISFRPEEQQQPIKPLSDYDQKVVRMRQRGMIYPYEIVKMLTPELKHARAEFPPGDFVEHELDGQNRLVPVNRPYGQNKSNIIAGVIQNFTERYPEGMKRVMLLGDPSKDLGALAEPECRRIIAALDLAEQMRVPLEWFPISAGAKISMESGVENMDWIARVLRRLVDFTQAGGEVNLLINGINVGAQPYWNAEATMLMHTRGILVMTPKAAMVLTGKRALDYSGSVSAEDNQGIGGYDRIMGINGQAQYWARDIDEACHILFRHYQHTYVAPGERFPRKALTTDPLDRNVCSYPHGTNGTDSFATVGEIFSNQTNPGRKKSFDVRRVMMAAVDQDYAPLERWGGMRAAETAVVWDAHLGGYPVCLIGMESRPLQRVGFVPADGPDQWTSGTLFPQSSKKVARAINAASNNRPVVFLANLSGFDGSPESMRRLQLEYGAEIGRAVVNFKGPIVFCVISRYHGGAYVVFSRTLNEQVEIAALEGAYASVIGGAPAAAVVFAGEVEARTKKDARLDKLKQEIDCASSAEKNKLQGQYNELFKIVHSEKLGEMAAEFDRVHSVQRALAVGALHRIIPPANLRPYLIDAVERGIEREQQTKKKASELLTAA